MHIDTFSPMLLVLAVALSWDRFATIFSGKTQAAIAAAPPAMIASAVALSSFGLAFRGSGLWVGVLVAALGPLLGRTVPRIEPALSLSIAVLCLAIYLHLGLAKL